MTVAAVASSSAQACAAAQTAVRELEGQLRDAQAAVAELQGRLAKQEEELELRREYDLYKQRSAHEKELAAGAEKQQAQLEQLQVRGAGMTQGRGAGANIMLIV